MAKKIKRKDVARLSSLESDAILVCANIASVIGTILWTRLTLVGQEDPKLDSDHLEILDSIIELGESALILGNDLFSVGNNSQAFQTAMAITGLVDRVDALLSVAGLADTGRSKRNLKLGDEAQDLLYEAKDG